MSDEVLKEILTLLRERACECSTISRMNTGNRHEGLFGGKASAFKEAADILERGIGKCT